MRTVQSVTIQVDDRGSIPGRDFSLNHRVWGDGGGALSLPVNSYRQLFSGAKATEA
jgi:hypothetical protein